MISITEYHWMQFGFVTRRRKTNTPEMQRTFFEFAAPKLGITKLDDWYKIQVRTDSLSLFLL
jgi:hypothetical protein